MRGGHSEVGKVDPGPYFREKDSGCLKKDYTSPLNSSPHSKNQVGLSRALRSNEWRSRYITPEADKTQDIYLPTMYGQARGLYIATYLNGETADAPLTYLIIISA